MKNWPFIFLITILSLLSILCSSTPEIDSTEKIIEIPIEKETMEPTKTKLELPTLIPSSTDIPFLENTSTSTISPDEWTVTPTQWIYKSSTPKPTPLCYCNRDYDCNQFATQKDAQFCFNFCNGSMTNNWSNLDSDHDEIACEDLP